MDLNSVQGKGVTGAGDAYVVTLSVGVEDLVDMAIYIIKFAAANGGGSTLNVNQIGAKQIQTNKLTALSANDIKAGSVHILVYDETADIFQAISIHV